MLFRYYSTGRCQQLNAAIINRIVKWNEGSISFWQNCVHSRDQFSFRKGLVLNGFLGLFDFKLPGFSIGLVNVLRTQSKNAYFKIASIYLGILPGFYRKIHIMFPNQWVTSIKYFEKIKKRGTLIEQIRTCGMIYYE